MNKHRRKVHNNNIMMIHNYLKRRKDKIIKSKYELIEIYSETLRNKLFHREEN